MKGYYFTSTWTKWLAVFVSMTLFQHLSSAQTLGEITDDSTLVCKLDIPVCNGDTVLLNPTNTVGFTNFTWYYGSVDPGNIITGANPAMGVISVSNDSLVATGSAAYGTAITRTFILTGEFATPAGCAAINDTILLHFTPTPVLATVPDTICTAAGESSNLMSLVSDASGTTGTTTFYLTLADALAETNAVGATVSPTATTKYYVRKETTAGCYDIDSLIVTVRCLSLGNLVWYDTNNNGKIDGGEAVIPGVTIHLYLDADGNGTLTGAELTPLATDITDGSGLYLFENLKEGKYFIGVDAAEFGAGGTLQNLYSSGTSIANNGVISETPAPAVEINNSDTDDNGTLQTSGALAGSVLTSQIMLMYNTEPTGETPDNSSNPNDSDDNLTADFGFYGMSIGSLVFMDINNDGTFSASDDMPAAGVTVKLYSADGSTLLATTTTGADGRYLFTNLPEGDYIVGVVTPAGKLSSDDIGTSHTPNSADNDDNGTSTIGSETWSNVFTLSAGAAPTGEADQAQTTAGGMGNPAVTDNPLTPDANSNLHVDFGFKPICPTITNPSADQVVCADEAGGAAGSDITVSTDLTAANSVRFVRFTTQQTGSAMYTGGTDLDIVTPAAGTATYTFDIADFPNTGTTPITYYVYAVMHPASADPTCRPFQEIEVTVNPRPTADPASLTECEATTGSGNFNFTLAAANAQVLNGQTGMTVTYHDTQADADNGANAITTKLATHGTIVYARVETSNGCYRTSQVTLNVNLRPQFTLSLPTVCPGQNPTVQITLGANADANPTVAVNGGAGFAYSTLSPAGLLTTANGILVNASNSVVLTNANTCTHTQTITTPPVAPMVCLPVKVTKLN